MFPSSIKTWNLLGKVLFEVQNGRGLLNNIVSLSSTYENDIIVVHFQFFFDFKC